MPLHTSHCFIPATVFNLSQRGYQLLRLFNLKRFSSHLSPDLETSELQILYDNILRVVITRGRFYRRLNCTASRLTELPDLHRAEHPSNTTRTGFWIQPTHQKASYVLGKGLLTWQNLTRVVRHLAPQSGSILTVEVGLAWAPRSGFLLNKTPSPKGLKIGQSPTGPNIDKGLKIFLVDLCSKIL
jgi:hypothetical protein